MPHEETVGGGHDSRSWAPHAFPVSRRMSSGAASATLSASSVADTSRELASRQLSKHSSVSLLDSEQLELERNLLTAGTGGERTVFVYRGRCGMVIIPSADNVLYGTWEAFTMLLMFACAFFIPFDILVCPGDEKAKPVVVGWFNLVMDLTFALDILVHFFLAYPKQAILGIDSWEVDQLLIARRYCSWPGVEDLDDKHGSKGMFWIDFLATAPSWLTRLSLVSKGEASKLLRTIRLTRVLRVANVGVRLEEIMSMHGLNLHILQVVKIMITAGLTFHLMACVWVGAEGTQGAEHDEDICGGTSVGTCNYLLAVYWAVVTMTGTGYGDKVGGDVIGYITCSALMFLSAFMWAWVTGVMISVITELTRNSDRLKGEISDLEDFCDDRCMPASLGKEAKVYMLWSKDGPKHGYLDSFMEERLSPRLIWEVKHCLRANVFERVWWARQITGSARAELCNLMTREYFGRHERSFLPQRTLIYIKQGSCRVNLNKLMSGDVWGAQQILYTANDFLYSQTLENLDCLLLTQDSLKQVCDRTSWVGSLVRREQVRLLVLRGMHRIAMEIRKRNEIARISRILGPRHIHVNRQIRTSFSGGSVAFRYDKLRQELTELSLEMLVITTETVAIQEISRRQTQLAYQLRAQLEELGAATEAGPPGGPWGPAARC